MFPPLIIIFTIFPILSLCQNVEQFADCTKNFYGCSETIQWIGYPFWGRSRPSYCGLPGFELTCRNNLISTIKISNTTFRVLRIDQNISRITLAREDLWNEPDVCLLQHQEPVNTTLHESSFAFIPEDFLFLRIYYSCFVNDQNRIPGRNRLNCSGDGGGRISFFEDRSVLEGVEECGYETSVAVMRRAFDEFKEDETMSLEKVLREGFPVEYQVEEGACSPCQSSGGACWSGDNSSAPSCLCPDGVSRVVCPNSGEPINLKRKLIIGVVAALIGSGLICCVYCCCRMPKNILKSRCMNKNDRTIEDFIEEYGSLTPKRYNYFQIKKITKSFQVKLGQGGFGTVFKGKLSDGRLVAVKLLNSSKANGEEFVNEVASIGRTSHVNVVALLGFCYEGQKRALIYEFMPNGSLDKFICNNVPLGTAQPLTVNKLYEVALGIARGLEYLHRGCNTRILHLDIKPHNILLDEDFCPKIADFGLAKLHSRKESIVSMLEARGTIGYIAPEVFSRNFGGVSHKSDVYSYGMMILEMVGGRENVNARIDHSSDMYFPHWIYKRLEEDELGLEGLGTVEENELVRKMILVGLWCIQTDPSRRPPMNKVIEMLQGSIDAITIPPKPFFSSSPRSPENMFAATSESISI